MITSIDNPKIKELIKLNKSKFRKENKMFIVEGAHLVSEAKKLDLLIETYTTLSDIDGVLISEAVMKKICNTDTVVNQIGVCKLIEKTNIENRVLILDGIQDPGNMGTLLRSAVAFNFNTVFLGDGSVDIYNPKVIRATQGAIFKLNLISGNCVEFIKKISDHKIYSTNVKNGILPKMAQYKEKIALILGNEGNGVSKEIDNLALDNIYIKMNETESLNVSIAGSIIMYELNNL